MENSILEKKIAVVKAALVNHIPVITKYDDLIIVDWKNANGSRIHSMKFIYQGDCVFISGDVGNAVFKCTWKAELGSFKDKNLEYLAEKLSAIDMSSSLYDFCPDEARKYLIETFAEEKVGDKFPVSKLSLKEAHAYFEEYRYDERCDEDEDIELLYALWDLTYDVTTIEEWERQVEALTDHSNFDYYDAQELFDIGNVYSNRVLFYIISLQMIDEYVAKNLKSEKA